MIIIQYRKNNIRILKLETNQQKINLHFPRNFQSIVRITMSNSIKELSKAMARGKGTS
jgi:hypothetical protein